MHLKIKNFFFLLSLILLPVLVHGQKIAKGVVWNKIHNKPIKMANIQLFKLKDSIMVEQAISDDQGAFTLRNGNALDSFYYKLSFLGMKPITNRLKYQSTGLTYLDTLRMEFEINNISEVVVKGNKIFASELVDRTVYDIPNMLSKASTTTYDLLRMLPGIQVDWNNKITLEGKTNLKIEVDGKERSPQYLARLTPKIIDKIEIITAPGAKYDSDIEGVISIITKKEYNYGLTGNILFDGQIQKNGFSNANSGLNYQFEKLNVYISGYGNLENFNGKSIYSRIDTLGSPNYLKTIVRNGNSNLLDISSQCNVGIDYDYNVNNTVSINYNISGVTFRTKDDLNNQTYLANLNTNSLDKVSKSISENSSPRLNHNASVFYKHYFNKSKNQGISGEIIYFYGQNSISNSNIESNFSVKNPSLRIFTSPLLNENRNNNRSSFNGKFDYFENITEKITFQSGFQYYSQLINNKTETQNIDSIGNVIYSKSDTFKYKENREAGYVSLNWSQGKFSLKGGLRIENSNISINNNSNNNYWVTMPNLNFLYKVKKTQTLRLSYIQSISRPVSYELNPHVSYIDSFNITKGNENLKPAFRYRTQLTYSINFKIGSISPQFFYEYRNHLIEDVYHAVTNIRIPENITSGSEKGFILYSNIRFKRVMFSTSYQYSINRVNSYKDLVLERENKLWRLSTSVLCTLPKDYTFSAVCGYASPVLTGQKTTKQPVFYGCTIEKQLKNNSKIGLSAFLPFSTKLSSNYTSNGSGFYEQGEIYYRFIYNINVKYSYNFNFGKKVNKQKRDIELEHEGYSKRAF